CHRSRRIHARGGEGRAQLLRGTEGAVRLVELVVREVEAAWNVPAAQAGPRLGLCRREAAARASVDCLFGAAADVAPHLVQVAHQGAADARTVARGSPPGGTRLHGPPLRAPLA